MQIMTLDVLIDGACKKKCVMDVNQHLRGKTLD